MLGELVTMAPGARGAVLCDFEGEFVELVVHDPALSDYEMKIFGAQVAAAFINLQNNSSQHGAGAIVELRLATAGGTLLGRALRDGYYLVLLLARGAPSAPASFALQHVATEMAAEL